MAWLRVIACIVALAGAPAAQAPGSAEDVEARIAELAQGLVGSRGCPGVVVGLIAGGRQRVLAFGKPSRDGDLALDGDSLFEIGSITKVFTGLLLARLAGDGEVRLDDAVQSLLPDSVAVPRGEHGQIRLVDLATHHSGLPRLPDNMRPKSVLDPYAGYTADVLYEFLASHELRREVGAEYEYSNLGMGLLGHALARRAGTGYEAAVRERLCRPLGMRDTAIDLGEEQRSRLARGHLHNGIPTPGWDLAALAGAGALRSSVHDMLRFAAACLEPKDEAFAAALALAMEPRHRLAPGEQIGLGWHISGDGEARTFWHNGATGGYNGYLAVRPARRAAVVLLANRHPGPASSCTEVGRAVLDLIAP